MDSGVLAATNMNNPLYLIADRVPVLFPTEANVSKIEDWGDCLAQFFFQLSVQRVRNCFSPYRDVYPVLTSRN